MEIFYIQNISWVLWECQNKKELKTYLRKNARKLLSAKIRVYKCKIMLMLKNHERERLITMGKI
jgi:hypothetical protein